MVKLELRFKNKILILALGVFFLGYAISVSAQQTCFNGEGVVCDGFCRTSALDHACIDGEFFESFTKICKSEADCENGLHCSPIHECVYSFTPTVKIKADYPKSVPISSDFEVELSFTSEAENVVDINLMDAAFDYNPTGFSNDYQQIVQINKVIHLNPNEEVKTTVKFKSDYYQTDFGRIFVRTAGFGAKSLNIIVYDPTRPTAICGERTYNLKNFQCIDGILYPFGVHTGYQSCFSDSDCQQGSCFQNRCLKPDNQVLSSDTYNALIVPLFVTDQIDDNQRKIIIDQLKTEAERANQWLKDEKDAWASKSKFSLNWNVVECPGYTRSEYLQDIKEKEEVEQIFKKIATTCGLQGYPIIYYFIKDQNDQEAVFALSKKFPQLPVSAGINFGEYVLMGGYSDKIDPTAFSPVLIHETLHSFGLFDIYPYAGEPGGYYQWRNCILYTAQWEEFFKKPHLCSLEAYMLGFIKDENTKRNKDSKTTCQNGAIDPPDCKSCSEGYELVANTCIKKEVIGKTKQDSCQNGAIDSPNCLSCSAKKHLVNNLCVEVQKTKQSLLGRIIAWLKSIF
ncbi:MAG: hypothetical protein AABX00_03480 [Nanoarchaeota archaeon]